MSQHPNQTCCDEVPMDQPVLEPGADKQSFAGNSSASVLKIVGYGASSAVSAFLILLVRLYQMTFRAILGGHCRFEPSCSEYFIQAVRKHGPIKGAFKGGWRICRCQPLCRGGYDPP
ncbi:membrane protein insertion efficiency factor YidD [Planctomicrobium sp. SH527]|uniref:membrane protein insertion efficiency factor YidD n=1 Tax=Planctomicrobium sp. SH527 TaxID=3448123 RepID=UPI003F5B0F73